jgi:general transcription factor 3C polypeptide 5 (transcription factor C subunit 1)
MNSAGPSTFPPIPEQVGISRSLPVESTEPISSYPKAPYRTYPKHPYVSIEYPGTVSHPASILRLIHQQEINECFNSPIASDLKMLEMSYKREDRNSVPVRGTRVGSAKLLVKIVRRRRRKDRQLVPVEGEDMTEEGIKVKHGVFTASIIGPINQTVRFRCKCYTE